ncbi:MAG: hypothetical protein GY765_29855 [bacterium]|nr:hypothetical protein [bacterium]
MSKSKQESLFWGVIMILVGGLLLLDNIGVDIDVWDFIWNVMGRFWPLILVAIGAKMIWRHHNEKKAAEQDNELQ